MQPQVNTKILANLRDTRKTPYMLTDLSVIEEQCKVFKELMPGVKLYYAVKCFNDDEVIKTVDKYVDGYDIASTAEIKQLLTLGIKPDRINFSNPVKSDASLRQAHRWGVTSFAFQSVNELVKIKKCAPGSKVYVRLKVADQASSIAFSSKFGAEPSSAADLLMTAKDFGLIPAGLTFHVGSQATDPLVWDSALRVCQSIQQELTNKGIAIEFINLGGGFPVQYSSQDPTLRKVAPVIHKAIRKYIPDVKHLIAEPGRFIVADSSVIVTKVIGVEERGNETWLYLDTGTFQSFMEVFEFNDFPYPVYSLKHLLNRTMTPKTQKYVLTGPSCDSYDTMAHNVELPSDIAVGDTLVVGMAGAYTIVYGSAFNGFKVPPRMFIK